MSLKKLRDVTEKCIITSLQRNNSKWLFLYRMSQAWEQIVGSHIAAMVKIKDFTDDNRMVLQLTNPAYAMEANIYRNIILERTNLHFGVSLCSEVIISSFQS